MRRISVSIFFLTIVWLAFPIRVQAAAAGESCQPPECLNLVEALSTKGGELAADMVVRAAHGAARFVWLVDKGAMSLFSTTVENTLWDGLRNAVLDGMRQFMPDVLRTLIGGDSGLLQIALMLAGLLLTLPFAGASGRRLVRPDRVILWAVLISALFISSGLGYDLIGGVEDLRVNMMRTILSGRQDQSGAETLIMVPMMAERSDLAWGDLSALPGRFEQTYFPEARTRTVKVLWAETSLFDGAWEVQFETPASLQERTALSREGFIVALLSLPAAYILLVFALIFALLSIASMSLMVFLVAGLGLGFFEFGQTILAEILRRYFQIVFLSLGVSVFLALLGRALGSIQGSAHLDVPSALRNLAVMLPVAMVVNSFLKWAFGTMTASLGAFGASTSVAFAPALSGMNRSAQPGAVRSALATGLQAAGTKAMLAVPGVAGIAASAAAGMAAQRLSGSRRGDVFAQMQQSRNDNA